MDHAGGMTRRDLFRTGAAIGLGAALTSPLLAACGKSANKSGSDSLEVGVLYKAGSPYYDAYQRVKKQVADKFPGIHLTDTFANTDARPKLQLRWKQGSPPDIDYVYNSADPSTTSYVTENRLLDLSPLMQSTSWDGATSWADAVLPAFAHFAQYQGKYFVAPEEAVVMGLFYNGKLFDKLGLQPPTTFDELLDVSKKIKNAGVAPIAVTGTFQPYMGLWWDHLLLRYAGSEPVTNAAWKTGKLASVPGAAEAAQALGDLVAVKPFIDGFSGIDFTAAQSAFFQGKAAMILMGSWLQGEMKKSIPADFDLRVAPFPTVSGGSGDARGLFGTLLGQSVWKGTKNEKSADYYLQMSCSKQEQATRVKDLGVISPYRGEPGPPGVQGMAELVDLASSGTVTYYYYGIANDAKRTEAWYGPVSQVFLAKLSPDKLISTIDSRLGPLVR